jgi:hypothetical protein
MRQSSKLVVAPSGAAHNLWGIAIIEWQPRVDSTDPSGATVRYDCV